MSPLSSASPSAGDRNCKPLRQRGCPQDGQQARSLPTLDEVRRLGAAFDHLEATGANGEVITIARLWALTGCRRDEIAGLRWSEVDFERGLLVLCESKTGKSVRPLGVAVTALLKGLTKHLDSEFVFPAEI